MRVCGRVNEHISSLVEEAVDEPLCGHILVLEDILPQHLHLACRQDVSVLLQVQQQLVPIPTVFLIQVVHCICQLVIRPLRCSNRDVGLQEVEPPHLLLLQLVEYLIQLMCFLDDAQRAHHDGKLGSGKL
jgi:hypothetical protein